MQAEAQKEAVQPTPLLLQAVSKVEQVVARLQELQSSITGSYLATPSKVNSPSCRMPDLLEYSPTKSALDCGDSGDKKKLSRSKGSTSFTKDERRKSLTLAEGWRHWSSPAKDVHDVISEILLASKFTKQFVSLVGRNPVRSRQDDSVDYSPLVLKPVKKLILDTKAALDSSSKRNLQLSTGDSVTSTVSSGEDLLSGALEPTVCSSVESLSSTPLSSNRPVPLNRRSSSKKSSIRKPPPHLFKVVVGNEGPAAKTGSAISLRQVESQKLEARKLTTPYKRKSGTLVQRPPSAISDLRSSCTSQSSILRSSIERNRLHNSSSLRRSTEKFVEACRALMEEEELLKRSNGQTVDKSVHFSNSPPLIIKPLSFDSPPSVGRTKAPMKNHKNWLIRPFSRTTAHSSAREAALIKPRKKASTSKNLPTLISRLPSQKMEPAAVAASTERVRLTALIPRTSFNGVGESLPLPPARQSSARGMALKASKDKKSGITTYALESVDLPRISRDLTVVNSNSMREREKNRFSGGCPSKDLDSQSKDKSEVDIGTPTEHNIPSYMRAKAAGGPGKENKATCSNTLRNSSARLDQKSTVAKHGSGTSLLHRAKDWVSLHKIKDKGVKRFPGLSQRTALAS